MLLKEFDVIINRMQLAFETAENLGQPVDAVKILYQMNEILPKHLQLTLESEEDSDMAKQMVSAYSSPIKSAITEYREELMLI